ncbi:hypothetical protein V6N13_083819 [Hibiscus sabdariffa]|uniref:Uncharacterized protein n=1 Tax=Hibiscus sabdariffa TaxID=183260 RepID=A0ABR2SZQ9_9ROSI
MDEFGHGRVASLTRIGNRLVKPATVMEGSATLVQVALQGDKGKPNFYDVNLIDGYNLPVSVATQPFSLKCTIKGYSKNLNNLCPQELQVVNKNEEVVACKSACLAFDFDLFCCRNEYETPEMQTELVFKDIKYACPCYYIYDATNFVKLQVYDSISILFIG